MADPLDHRRAPRGVLGSLQTVWGWLVDGMAAFGTALIVMLMFVICADVVVRNIFGGSLPLVAELGALMVVMIVYLQLGAAIRHRRLARAGIFIDTLWGRRPRAAAAVEAAFDLVGALMLGLIAWSTLRILEADLARGQFIGVTGVLTVPTWPFRAAILLGMTISTIQFAGQILALFTAAAAGAAHEDSR
jgi:TRAP-type C4-dicarboxylate transport system permease small subunit